MKEEQSGTGAEAKARPRMSIRSAALWAVKISLACNVLLIVILMILGSNPHLTYQINLPDWLLPGFALWNVVFGGAWHNSLIWLSCSLALNVIVYFGIVFTAEGIFMLWRRWLHPANTESRSLIR